MKSIAIILNDNDFGHTFRPLLETLYRAMAEGELISAKPEEICLVIQAGIKFHLMAFQWRYELHNDYPCIPDFDRTADYLSSIKVLFDDEADKAYHTEDHDSGAWHLHVQSGQVSSF